VKGKHMPSSSPVTQLDARYSSGDAAATPWATGSDLLREAPLYWLTTVRPNGQPHVTPLLGVWQDDAFHFTTGEREQKARNLEQNAHCTVLTGTNTLEDGIDVSVEGSASRVTNESELHKLAEAWVAKYGEEWRFRVKDGAFLSELGGKAPVFRVTPTAVFGFGKGETFSQTRWSFKSAVH
jgi:general stress protein 26